MQTPSPSSLAAMVLTAPAWVRSGIAAPSGRMREAAALELGAIIANQIERPVALPCEDQMPLPL